MGGRLSEAIDIPQIVEGVEFWRQTTMDTKKLLVHDGCQGQGAEGFHNSIVELLGILVLALELEGEVVREMAAFVVASQEEEGLGVPDFQRPEVEHAFDAEVAPINVVAEEEVSSIRWVAADFEELHEIELEDDKRVIRVWTNARIRQVEPPDTYVLTVYVTTNWSKIRCWCQINHS